MLIVVELERLLPGHPHFSMLLAKNNHFFANNRYKPLLQKYVSLIIFWLTNFFSKKNTYKNSTHCCNVFQKK